MASGELIVTGNGAAQIQLIGQPVRMNVYFDDEGEIIVPCNPHYYDKLDWTISGNVLTINYQVYGVRAIKWDVGFYWKEIK
jgi:hypothetical protein